jgi:hypothetical protein
MRYFVLRPEVPGRWGDNSVMDTSVHPPNISYFQFVFEDWNGSDFFECLSYYFCTDDILNELKLLNIGGFIEIKCTFEIDEQLAYFEPNIILPNFNCLKIIGVKGLDDMFLTRKFHLAVSKRVLDILESKVMYDCEIYELSE